MSREYVCNKCGAGGVKLWRDYGTPFHWDLWCVDCACAKSDPEKPIDPRTVRDDGTRVADTYLCERSTGQVLAAFKGEINPEYVDDTLVRTRERTTDQLGWYVPAIQSQDDPEVYWGYTSWTEERRGDWDYWIALPLRSAA